MIWTGIGEPLIVFGAGVWGSIRVWASEDILVASGANNKAGACYSLVGPRLTIAFILILVLDRDCGLLVASAAVGSVKQ